MASGKRKSTYAFVVLSKLSPSASGLWLPYRAFRFQFLRSVRTSIPRKKRTRRPGTWWTSRHAPLVIMEHRRLGRQRSSAPVGTTGAADGFSDHGMHVRSGEEARAFRLGSSCTHAGNDVSVMPEIVVGAEVHHDRRSEQSPARRLTSRGCRMPSAAAPVAGAACNRDRPSCIPV